MNNEFTIVINTVDMANKLVGVCNEFEDDIDIVSGKHIIDAKSIMGILSYDLTKKLKIRIHSENQYTIARFINSIKDFKTDD